MRPLLQNDLNLYFKKFCGKFDFLYAKEIFLYRSTVHLHMCAVQSSLSEKQDNAYKNDNKDATIVSHSIQT